ncbi:MAG: hybrid sensor histidine kinase/response regulator, partial [Chlamydiota bacterium]|nr:hybrid sensor histidine kinase/response regulator [Chlamydiota bacterium]
QKETFDQIQKEKKNIYNFTHKNNHQNGSFVWLSSSGMPMFDEAGHFIGFRGSDINITLRMRIMEELELAKQKAEEATRLKDKFVSLVAHDLKSPMASILGFIRLIRTSAKNALSEKEQKMLSMTQDSAERMIAMVEELLDISRLQSGVIKLLKTFVDGHKIGLLVQASLGYLAADKGIRIENLVPSGTRLYADPSLFVEVISNLVLNAIKFSKSGSTVKIYVPSAEKRSILAVSDTGVGVPDYIQENIFNHAQKTNTLGTAGERGTGLGLPYSYEIMKAHQGSLTFETVAGQGSVFYAELPVTEPRVLLVERDALVRYNYKAQLDAIGAKSFEADCAAAALDLLEKTMPHLIVMDILMPDMEGQDFLKRVKSSSQTLHIPVIVISSNTAHHVREQILEIGAEDFCDHKPIGIEEFTGRVRKYIV